MTRTVPHHRLSVNSISSMHQPLTEDMSMWAELGVSQVGLTSRKLAGEGWDRSAQLVREAGLEVANVATEGTALAESLRFSAEVGCPTAYFCTGPATSRAWEGAVDSFCESIASHVATAGRSGVRLAVEPTNPLRAHRSFVFSFRDALDLAYAAGIGVVLDIYVSWCERGLEQMIRDNVDAIALVQISDYVLGTLDTPNRAVPGDGDVPLSLLISEVLEAGYEGPFDLEILGPRIESEGYARAICRSIERTSELLDRLGA